MKSGTLRKDAAVHGGYGRGMDNKMARATKHRLDRLVDKRRRRSGKLEIVKDANN